MNHSTGAASQGHASLARPSAPLPSPIPSSAQSHMHFQSDPQSQTTPYYAPHSTPQQTSFSAYASATQPNSPPMPSPTSTAGLSRGMGSLASQGGLSPPLSFHPTGRSQSYGGYGQQPVGHMLGNVHQPGAAMAMMNINGLTHGFGHGAHSHLHAMYGHHGHAQAPPPPLQDRPFKCDVCPQSFNRNHDLKRHKRIHLAVKPFPCNFCDKSFSRKDALKRHRLVKGCGEKAVAAEAAAEAAKNEYVSPTTTAPDCSDDAESPGFIKRDV
ncbi:hypothetical protein P8C59_009352 [Phyllachora maydis]|uniref:C2H2-type domain-containing protein n=1 Tax=Phyllachora maydis TaxID=1825666 RepID=A0AAD9IDI8_9PEZI|nr:hypothetical protein P8C59_009352 [Phyllachora maydis]